MVIVIIAQREKRLLLLLERALALQAIYLTFCGQAYHNFGIGLHSCCK